MNIDVGNNSRASRSEAFRPDGTGLRGQRPFVPNRHELHSRGPGGGARLVIRTLFRVLIPAIGLLALLALMYLYRTEPAPWFDGLFTGMSKWLSIGALCVPLTILAVHLTSRRYGPAIAAAQVFVAWLAVAFVWIAHPLVPRFELGGTDTDLARVGFALPVSLLLAHLVAIAAFDATRNTRWWTAPLQGFLWGCAVFALVFYSAAYVGTDGPWFQHLMEYLAASLIVSVALLVPYWIARPIVRPLPGLAGY